MHERYTEVLRSRCDLMERVKILIGNEEGLQSLGTNFNPNKNTTRKIEIEILNESEDSIPPQKTDLGNPSAPRQAWIDTDMSMQDEDASIIEDVEEIPRDRSSSEREREKESLTGMNFISFHYLLMIFKANSEFKFRELFFKKNTESLPIKVF